MIFKEYIRKEEYIQKFISGLVIGSSFRIGIDNIIESEKAISIVDLIDIGLDGNQYNEILNKYNIDLFFIRKDFLINIKDYYKFGCDISDVILNIKRKKKKKVQINYE